MKKIYTLLLLLLAAVLLFGAGFPEENTPDVTSAYFHEHGVFHVSATFPLTENEMVNAEIYKHVRREIDGFKAGSEGGRLEMRYTLRYFNRRIISFTIHTRGYNAWGGLASNSVTGLAFDLHSGTRLELSDIFYGDFLWHFSALGIPVSSDFKHFALDTMNLYVYLHDEITIPLTHFGGSFNAGEIAAADLPQPESPQGTAIDVAIRDWYQENKGDEEVHFPLDASKPPGWRQVEVVLDMFKEILEEEEHKTDSGRKYVALTFDDGPERVVTTRILDALAEHNAKATFFVLGQRVPIMPDIVERMHREGHQIGNHSFDHRQLNAISESAMQWQITETNRIIEEITGSRVNLLRPPYGASNARVTDFARYLDMAIITWDIDPRDWVNFNAKSIAEHIVSRAEDGSIILMHDIFPSTAQAAEIVLRELTARGFVFVTVEELINMNSGLVPGLTFRNGKSEGR